MSFEYIDFFMSCAACLNFSLAAKYHFVSVSTLSRNISALEAELGVKLFERGFHGNKLTDAGVDFFKYCVDASMMFDEYKMKWGLHNHDEIRIGCYSDNKSFEKLIRAYSKAPAEHFTKKIKVYFVPEKGMLKALNSGYIDVAVTDMSEVRGENEIRASYFFTEDERDYVFAIYNTGDSTSFNKLARLVNYLK